MRIRRYQAHGEISVATAGLFTLIALVILMVIAFFFLPRSQPEQTAVETVSNSDASVQENPPLESSYDYSAQDQESPFSESEPGKSFNEKMYDNLKSIVQKQSGDTPIYGIEGSRFIGVITEVDTTSGLAITAKSETSPQSAGLSTQLSIPEAYMSKVSFTNGTINDLEPGTSIYFDQIVDLSKDYWDGLQSIEITIR